MAVAVTTALATVVPAALAGPSVAAEIPAVADLVIPARTTPDPSYLPVYAATAEGLLRRDSSGSYFAYEWTDYRTGKTTPLTLPLRVGYAGEHTISLVHEDSQNTVVYRDMRDNSERTFTVPEGQWAADRFEDSLLTVEGGDDPEFPEPDTLHLLTLENGRTKDRLVTGLPDDLTSIGYPGSSSRFGRVLTITRPSGTSTWFVGPDGVARPAPEGAVVMGDRLVRADSEGPGKPRTFAVWDLGGPFGEQDAKRVRSPLSGEGGSVIGVVGGDLVVRDDTDKRVVALPIDGSPHRVLLGELPWSVDGGSGHLFLTTQKPDRSRAIHAVRPDSAGRAQPVKVLDLPLLPVKVPRVAMENGRHYSIEVKNGIQDITEYVMPAAGTPTAGTRKGRGYLRNNQCGSEWHGQPSCSPIVAAGGGRIVYAGYHGTSLQQTDPGVDFHTINAVKPVPESVQASGRFAAYLRSDDASRPVEVFDLDRRKVVRTLPLSDGVFALSGYWLWKEKDRGVVEAVDVRTGAVVRTDTVAGCDIRALDAWGSSVYWKCDGEAGVHDTGTGKNAPLPAHNSARLGNGFVAWEKDGVLRSTDLRGATGTRELGRPVDPKPGHGWAVDKYSGRIAYSDDRYDTHVFDSGVVNGGISAIDRDTPAAHDVAGGTKSWSGAWFLNKTAASWTLTVRAKAGGAVVRTITGGEARGVIRTGWDGKDAQGRLVGNGAYDWTLTGKPADGQGPDLKSTGTVQLTGGGAVHRDVAGRDGFGDLVTLDNSGNLAFHAGDGKGGLSGTKVTGAGWPTTSTVVPFGDVNGDRCNDVLVRNSAGTLRSYQPACGTAVAPTTGNTWLGTGFNAYDVLTSAGDVTGDGRADLLGRQASTGDL
ncbi:FlgD immunoglobulin-like domain containing protein, partial [Streptomyces sp. NPDC089799]|uniref:FlgD immunoglobulin-like domain containing protein n=1 Tax=Streptomyces sp. NPDC089799 TaxID=3155066 RepID=UPI00343BD6D4